MNNPASPHNIRHPRTDNPEVARIVEEYRSTGDSWAAEELYRRTYPEALGVARAVSGGELDAEDLAAEGFTRTLEAIRHGHGPTTNFSGYLNTTIRNLWADRWRHIDSRNISTANVEETMLEVGQRVGVVDSAIEALPTEELVHRALTSLAPRWRQVLWSIDVEGNRPAEYANAQGVTTASTYQMLHRARQGLRQAYLHEVVGNTGESCQTFVASMISRELGTLRKRNEKRLTDHVQSCVSCQSTHLRVVAANSQPHALATALGGGALAASGKLMSAEGLAATSATGPLEKISGHRLLGRWVAGGVAVTVVAVAVFVFLRPSVDESTAQHARPAKESPTVIAPIDPSRVAELPEPLLLPLPAALDDEPLAPVASPSLEVSETPAPPLSGVAGLERTGAFALMDSHSSASTGMVELLLSTGRPASLQVVIDTEGGGRIVATSLPGCHGTATSMTCVVPPGFSDRAFVELMSDPSAKPQKTSAITVTTRASMVGSDGKVWAGIVSGRVEVPVG